MVENTHTEDEKIREDSNEGLDSSSNVVVVALAFVAAFVEAAVAPILPSPSFVLLHCYRNSSFASKMATTAQL